MHKNEVYTAHTCQAGYLRHRQTLYLPPLKTAEFLFARNRHIAIMAVIIRTRIKRRIAFTARRLLLSITRLLVYLSKCISKIHVNTSKVTSLENCNKVVILSLSQI